MYVVSICPAVSRYPEPGKLAPGPSLQLVQVLEPRQDDVFTRLLNLPAEKDFIKNSIHLIKKNRSVLRSSYQRLDPGERSEEKPTL